MSIKTFNAYEDLDRNFWLTRAYAEAQKIYDRPSTRGFNKKTGKPRTLDEVRKDTAFGHAPECMLIKECGYVDDTREYKDLFDKNGNSIEIKTVENIKNVPFKLKECVNLRTEKSKYYPHKENWRNFPDIVYVFIGNKETGDYHFHSKYVWHGLQRKYY